MIDHIGQMPSVAAKKFKNKQALTCDGQSFTFEELSNLIEKFSSSLHSLGIKEKDVVTLYASNSWEWIVSYFSIARIGAIINPVNTMLTPSEIKHVVNDCKAKAIITSSDKVQAIINIKHETSVNTLISFGNAPEGTESFNNLIKTENKPIQMPNIIPEDLSTIGYTSGTTGHPKGAMQSHKSVIINGAMTSQLHMRGPEDVVVSALPCPHVYANVLMTGMMMFGTKLVLHQTFDPLSVFKDIEKHNATIFDGVPTMFMFMLNHKEFKNANLYDRNSRFRFHSSFIRSK